MISTDVPASVVEFVGGPPGLRCAETPCALTMTYGDHELAFAGLEDKTRQSTAVLHVAHAAVVMNHRLGQEKGNPAQGHGGTTSHSDVGGIAISGLGLLLLGFVVMAASPSTHQDGATTQWAPEAPPARGPMGFKF